TSRQIHPCPYCVPNGWSDLEHEVQLFGKSQIDAAEAASWETEQPLFLLKNTAARCRGATASPAPANVFCRRHRYVPLHSRVADTIGGQERPIRRGSPSVQTTPDNGIPQRQIHSESESLDPLDSNSHPPLQPYIPERINETAKRGPISVPQIQGLHPCR